MIARAARWANAGLASNALWAPRRGPVYEFSVSYDPKPVKREVARRGKFASITTTTDTDYLTVLKSAANRAADRVFIEGPVAVDIVFWIKRPKSVRREYPTVKPDIDNLVKPVMDAITQARVWSDDAIVIDQNARKRYADEGGVDVRIACILGHVDARAADRGLFHGRATTGAR